MQRRHFLLLGSHAAVGAAGFAAGVYMLPLLIEPERPDAAALAQAVGTASYQTRFRRDLPGSDALHWGEGEVMISAAAVALNGRLAPGPDYRLYFSPVFVDNEADFERLKPQMRQVGAVRTFHNFVVELPPDLALEDYRAVVVWCERFRQFITAAAYR